MNQPDTGVPMWAFVALLGLLQIFIGILLTRLWQAVDKNTEAVAALREALPTIYATKDELLRVETHAQDQARDLAQDLQSVGNRVTILEAQR